MNGQQPQLKEIKIFSFNMAWELWSNNRVQFPNIYPNINDIQNVRKTIIKNLICMINNNNIEFDIIAFQELHPDAYNLLQ